MLNTRSTDGVESQRPPYVLETTLLLALGTEAAFFGTLVTSYLFLRTTIARSPFAHLTTQDLVLAAANTVALLTSAGVATLISRAAADHRRDALSVILSVLVLLGSLFLVGQVVEFLHSGMQVDDAAYGGAFLALIGFHAVHVVAGITLLAMNLARLRLGDFDGPRHDALTVGAGFWYFVVVVWLVLFCILYLV